MSLKEYNKLTIPANSGPDITLELNWSKETGAEKLVKVNGESIIKLNDLYMFMMVAGNEEEAADLMPTRHTEVTHFERVHRAKAQRDIKKGEEIRVRCLTSVPTTVVEGLAGLVDKKIQVRKQSDIPIIKVS